MHSITPSLDQPIERAARLVALDLLESANKARARLDEQTDADALHHFRVTLRRLRTWLRTLQPWLEDSTSKKASRRLRKAAWLTSDSRDAEVHLAWLQDQRRALSARQRHGWAWLVERIEQEKEQNDAVGSTKGMRAFDRAAAKLARRLPYYRAHVDPHAAHASRPFAVVLSELIRDQGAVLAARLKKITSFEDAKAIHNARIAGKRLRYIVEPVAEQIDGGSELVANLGELQDALGGCHDAHVFAGTIIAASEALPPSREQSLNGPPSLGRRPSERHRDLRLGLLALAGRLQERGEQSFADVREKWLTSQTLAEETERLAQALASRIGQSPGETQVPLGDGRTTEQAQQEVDPQRRGNGRRAGAGKRTRHAHSRGSSSHSVRSLEEPAVSQTPRA